MNAREAAYQTLDACRRNGAWSEVFLGNLITKEHIDKREAALAYSICFTILQNESLCDHYISAFSKVKPKKMEASVLQVLRIAACQIFFLTKIPKAAAVNECVELAKKYCPKKSLGFINAVSRSMAAADKLPDFPNNLSKAEFYALKYSHPLWLSEYFVELLGFKEAQALMAANNAVPRVTIHLNTLKANMEQLLTSLENDGFECEMHPEMKECIILSSAGGIENSEAYKNGWFQIQDCAARLAVMASEVKPGMNVLDACSAPGGKSFAAAMMMENKGKILSCDFYENELKRIESGRDRLGVDILTTRQMDASVYAEELKESFDVVIADVPCSGMGVIRKKPEIRKRKQEDVKLMPELQLAIADNLAKYVKPGGVLLYSTCTVCREENEGVIETFLQKNKEFKAEAFDIPVVGRCESGMVTLWPHIHQTDGFFVCKMRKGGAND